MYNNGDKLMETNKQTTLSIDVEVLKKFTAIANRAKLTKVEILTDIINGIYAIMEDSIESTNRMTLGVFPDIKNSLLIVKVGAFSFGGLEVLPKEISRHYELLTQREDQELQNKVTYEPHKWLCKKCKKIQVTSDSRIPLSCASCGQSDLSQFEEELSQFEEVRE